MFCFTEQVLNLVNLQYVTYMYVNEVLVDVNVSYYKGFYMSGFYL